MTEKTADSAAIIEALQKRIVALEEALPKTGTYKQLQESIATGVQQVLSGPRFHELIMDRVRAVSMGREDLTSYVMNAAKAKTNEWITSSDGTRFLQETVLTHNGMRNLIDQNVQACLQKREFITALSAGFRAAVVAEPAPLTALVEALAADEKGLLAKSLTNNPAFMDQHTKNILTKLRDSLA